MLRLAKFEVMTRRPCAMARGERDASHNVASHHALDGSRVDMGQTVMAEGKPGNRARMWRRLSR